MSDRTLAQAVKDALTTKLQAGTSPPTPPAPDLRAKALDYDEAQFLEEAEGEVLPKIHVLVSLTRRFGGNARISSHKTVAGWRLTATAVALTVDEARWAAERVAQLEFSRIVAAGYDLSPLMFETANAPEADKGWYSGATSWTFTTTPA